MPFCANTFLIGAQRSGTTHLAHLLSGHPQITVSEPKEPVFFAKNWHRGFDWYAERFGDKQRPISLDASTWYSVAPTRLFPVRRGPSDAPFVDIPARIHAASPDAKFIYVLRDPVPRTNSLYWLLRHDSPEYRRFASLREALERDPFMLRTSDYMGQIDNYLEYYGRDRFLVLIFEEVIRDMPAALDRCFSFLGLDRSGYAMPRWSNRNESFRYTSLGETCSRLMRSGENLDRARRRLQRMGGPGRWINERLVAPIPPPSAEDRNYIKDMLAGPNERLVEFLGRPITHWSS